MIGGGLFSVSRDEGSYSVGVYDRSLFDKPVSHLVQWEAIKHMKAVGLKWYYIGQRFYSGDIVQPTAKEMEISYFKEGFSSNVFVNMTLKSVIK